MRVSPLIAALLLTSACIHQEVGYNPANETFGVSSFNNERTQSAAYQRGEFLMQERARFAAETTETVTFAFDRAGLDRTAQRALNEQAAWLLANPDVRVRIYGHTDLVGGETYNDRLGLRRARAAARYLVRRGVARSRLDTVASRGEREPVVPTDGRERLNRRTETEVAGFIHGFIGEGMDGKRALLMYQRYISDSVERPERVSLTETGGSE